MRGNQITELTSDTFKRTDQSINRLDLSSNQLTRVNFSMFDSYNQLQVSKTNTKIKIEIVKTDCFPFESRFLIWVKIN